ncbi:MAG: hypothetical protein ACI4SC_00955 [Candidatus Neoclostridium sp.]
MKAIVYTSKSGHTAEYAEIIGKKTGLPVFSLSEKAKLPPSDTEIIYLGWLMANGVKGYKKAAKKYRVSAVCAVGLCDTGTCVSEVRKATSVPDGIPVFTMQGGMDKSKLRGINKLLINMLIRGLSSQKERSETDERILYLLTHEENFVSENNVAAFMQWYEENSK